MLTIRAYETSQELAQAIGTSDPKAQPSKVKKSAVGSAVEILRLPKEAAGRSGKFAGILQIEVYAQVQGTKDAANAQVQTVRIGVHNDNEAWSTLGTQKTENYPGATLTDIAVSFSTTTGDLVVSCGSPSKALEVYGVCTLRKLPATYDGVPET